MFLHLALCQQDTSAILFTLMLYFDDIDNIIVNAKAVFSLCDAVASLIDQTERRTVDTPSQLWRCM